MLTVAMQSWIEDLWLDVQSHVTAFNQSACFISPYNKNTNLKFVLLVRNLARIWHTVKFIFSPPSLFLFLSSQLSRLPSLSISYDKLVCFIIKRAFWNLILCPFLFLFGEK